MPAIVENVVYQHAENACSLWLQRHNAVSEPHYTYTDLVHLDNRVEANLDGLRIAGQHAMPIVEENITGEDAGAYFTKGVLLLESRVTADFLELVEGLDADSEALEEIQSALAWVGPENLAHVVKELLNSTNSTMVELGLNACAAHQRPAKMYLDNALVSSDVRLRSTAMKTAGNLGLVDLKHRLAGITEWESDQEKFHCARALALLGNQSAGLNLLHSIALGDSSFNSQAVNLITMLNDLGAGKSLLKALDAKPERQRDVVRGFGYLGDPVAVDWLINKTDNPELCRLAGGSISMITGIDLAESDLETLDEPVGFSDPGPNDDSDDDNVSLDEDEDLPWPDPELVRVWWQSSSKLPAGKRYLDGREKIESELKVVLRESFQRQRNAAAESLALLDPAARYLDTYLPTNKQNLWVH